MRIIFSRKGIDSKTEPCTKPSPEFSDGTFVSIPIPYGHSPVRYDQIASVRGDNMGTLVSSLMNAPSDGCAHLDPDLFRASRQNRHPEWRPAFGQNNGPLSHLKDQGVTDGDLFLFYGRFQPVDGSPLRYRRHPDFKNGDFQAVWGWLRVGECIDLDRETVPAGNADHPHAHGSYRGGNMLFIAAGRLGLPSLSSAPGGGVLPRLRPLTHSGAAAATWTFDKSALTKHRQEYVGDSDRHPELLSIALDLLSDLR